MVFVGWIHIAIPYSGNLSQVKTFTGENFRVLLKDWFSRLNILQIVGNDHDTTIDNNGTVLNEKFRFWNFHELTQHREIRESFHPRKIPAMVRVFIHVSACNTQTFGLNIGDSVPMPSEISTLEVSDTNLRMCIWISWILISSISLSRLETPLSYFCVHPRIL